MFTRLDSELLGLNVAPNFGLASLETLLLRSICCLVLITTWLSLHFSPELAAPSLLTMQHARSLMVPPLRASSANNSLWANQPTCSESTEKTARSSPRVHSSPVTVLLCVGAISDAWMWCLLLPRVGESLGVLGLCLSDGRVKNGVRALSCRLGQRLRPWVWWWGARGCGGHRRNGWSRLRSQKCAQEVEWFGWVVNRGLLRCEEKCLSLVAEAGLQQQASVVMRTLR